MKESISIVGIGCRFPGDVDGPDEFWSMLCEGRVGISDTPKNRWSVDDWVEEGMDPSSPSKGKIISSKAGWLEDPYAFDPRFWKVSNREAEYMDPQQRISLEVTYEAFCDANITLADIKGSGTGVFVGGGQSDFQSLTFAVPDAISPHSSTGVSPSIIANRISYLMDLRGPSLVVDTACSSSMTALHLACKSIENGECELAVVIGVLSILSPATSIGFTQTQFLSPTGTSRPFDKNANGFVRGEGCGAIILKRDAAVGYAKVIGTGINEDGGTISLTHPSSSSQESLIRSVVQQCDLSVDQLSYIEAHGTGTATGDPIESNSIGKAFAGRHYPLPIGSVKGNVGHLENAAGIVGVIKAALMLKHGKYVPTPNFVEWNPEIDAETLNIKIQMAVEDLPLNPVIGVNSYGFGGANGHAMLSGLSSSNAIAEKNVSSDQEHVLILPLSSHYREGLDLLRTRWQSISAKRFAVSAHQYPLVRDHFDFRRSYVGKWTDRMSPAEFFANAQCIEGEQRQGVKLAFVYGGQGSHYAEMGRSLALRFGVFESAAEEINTAFVNIGAPSYIDELNLFKPQPMDEEKLSSPQWILPSIVIVQYAMTKLLHSFGISPCVSMGHSSGELVAAWQSGGIGLDDLCRLTYARAQGQSNMASGAMAALAIGVDAAKDWLPQGAEVAAVNGERSITVSGSEAIIENVMEKAERQGIYCKQLPVNRAYHGRDVETFKEDFQKLKLNIDYGELDCPFISTVYPQRKMGGEDFTIAYWWDSIREPVQFHQALEVLQKSCDCVVEISPNSVLYGYITESLPKVDYISPVRKGGDEVTQTLISLAKLYALGHSLNWQAIQQPVSGALSVPIPPWQHKESFVPKTITEMTQRANYNGRSGEGGNTDAINLNTDTYPFLLDHTLDGKPVFPGAGFAHLALQRLNSDNRRPSLKSVRFDRFFFLNQENNNDSISWQREGVNYRFVHDGHLISSGSLAEKVDIEEQSEWLQPLFDSRQDIESTNLSANHIYDLVEKYTGYRAGPSFRLIERIVFDDGNVIAQLKQYSGDPWKSLSIPYLDAIFQVLGFCNGLTKEIKAPQSIDYLRVFAALESRSTASPITVYGKLTELTTNGFKGDLDVYVNDQRLLAVRGLNIQLIRQTSYSSAQLYALTGQPRGFPEEPAQIHFDDEDQRLAWILKPRDRVLRILDLQNALNDQDSEPLRIVKTEHDLDQGDSSFDIIVTDENTNDIGLSNCLVDNGMLCYPRKAVKSSTQQASFDSKQSYTILDDIENTKICETTEVVIDLRTSLLAISTTIKELSTNEKISRYIIVIRNTDRQGRIGFARTARIEFSRLNITTLMADGLDGDQLIQIIDSLPADEYEFYWLNNELSVPRLRPIRELSITSARSGEYRLVADKPGQLSSLGFTPIDQDKEGLEDREVLIAVDYISMHFKDLVLAMGLLPGFEAVLGSEICGKVLKCGSEAGEFKPGDRVYSFHGVRDEMRNAYMGSSAICNVDADLLRVIPDHLDPAVICSTAGVMATAYYSLYSLADVQKGEWVLIHSAMGGVGQAALQLATLRGARILASAGTEQKRNRLIDEFHVDGVLDSRSPANFLRTVRDYTDGQGVQLVINSLSGIGLQKSLECLAPGGRFVELGKRDIHEANNVSLALFKNNITFYSAHLDLLLESHYEQITNLFGKVIALLQEGKIKQIETEVLPFSEAPNVFARLAKAQHSGKIVYKVDREALDQQTLVATTRPLLLCRTRPYLFTGGTRGIGFQFAMWAIANGARRIVLCSQRGELDYRAELQLESVKKELPGLRVYIEKADLSDQLEVDSLLAKYSDLAGIFHFANHYVKGASDALSEGDLKHAFKAKSDAAWHLHEATKENRDLDIFFMATSIASLMGNPMQAAYTAANSSLYALAKLRRELGLPVVALDFPVILGCGRLSHFANSAELESNSAWGVGTISIDSALRFVEKILSQADELPAHLSLDDPNWDRYVQHFPNPMVFESQITLGRGESQESITVSEEEAIDLVKTKLADLLGCKAGEIDSDIPLTYIGVDSLAAIELATWSQNTFNINLNQLDVLSGLSVDSIVEKIMLSDTTSSYSSPNIMRSTPPSVAEDIAFDESITEAANASSPKSDEPADNTLSEEKYEAIAPTQIAVEYPNDKTVVVSLLDDSLSEAILNELLRAIDPQKVLVIQSKLAHFCLGMNLGETGFEDSAMLAGLELFALLYQRLYEHPLPIITVVNGAARGGGMLFPCIADITLCLEDATFGFPEIRQGGLPGIVSIAAQKKLSPAQCKTYMLTGDSFTAAEAKHLGLVDKILPSVEVAQTELNRLINRFNTIPGELLKTCKSNLPTGSVDEAMVSMGLLSPLSHPQLSNQSSLVNLNWPEPDIAEIELNDTVHHNAMDVALALDFKAIVDQLRAQRRAKVILLKARGDHFCTGVNPYTFIKQAQKTPLVARSALIYQLYDAFSQLTNLSVPIIGIPHGYVVGGGLGLAMMADWRICDADTTFVYGNLSRGVCPGFMLSEKLPQLLGESGAFDFYLQNKELNATEAKHLGIVNEIAESLAKAEVCALNLAKQIAAAPTRGVMEATGLMRTGLDNSLLAKEAVAISKCLNGEAFSGNWKVTAKHPSNEIDDVTPIPLNTIHKSKSQRQTNVGILDYECYIPVITVSQTALEEYDQNPGKYTAGLGQEYIAFCGDDQDAVSAAMTAVSRLLHKTGISPSEIGRLEIGTETLVDRSKSIKTFLMPLFGDNANIEGVDVYNACYGGTAALFNTISWIESSAWDGRYGIFVAVDIADFNEDQAFLNGFAAVAMLIGPDAAIAIEPERYSHVEHTFDFYKPVGWKDPYPLMRDGEYSIQCYIKCLRECIEGLSTTLDSRDFLESNDYFAFHCTSTYLCKRAFDEVCRMARPDMGLKERMNLYQTKVAPSTVLTKKIGSTYTASVYVNILSLLEQERENLIGKHIAVFSYGSGATASIYRLRVDRLPDLQGIEPSLSKRIEVNPEEFKRISSLYSSCYGKFDYKPAYTDHQKPHIYYLQGVDEWGIRQYARPAQECAQEEQLHFFPVHYDTMEPRGALCFIHSIGGEVAHYAPLANKIYQDRSIRLNCYGILSAPAASSVEQLIAYYTKHIKSLLDVTDNIFLAGYSSGCYSVVYLASWLEKQGIKVKGLFLIDPYSPSRLQFEPKTVPEIIQMVFKSYQLQGAASTIEEALEMLPVSWNTNRLDRYIKSWQQAHFLREQIPELPSWDGASRIYICPERKEETESGLALFRGKLTNRQETPIPGDHNSCMHYPHVQKLAGIMLDDVKSLIEEQFDQHDPQSSLYENHLRPAQ